MLRRLRQVRLVLESKLKEAEKEGDKKLAEKIRKVLGKRRLLHALAEECDAYYGSSYGGPLTDFLEWLLDHFPEILAMIEKLIALFSSDE